MLGETSHLEALHCVVWAVRLCAGRLQDDQLFRRSDLSGAHPVDECLRTCLVVAENHFQLAPIDDFAEIR